MLSPRSARPTLLTGVVGFLIAGAISIASSLTVSADHASAQLPRFQQVAGLVTIYEVVGNTSRALTFAEWQAFGSPAPVVVQPTIVKYPWSSTLYASAPSLPGVAAALSFPDWQRLGFPAAGTRYWIPGSYVYKWETSDELFVVSPARDLHKLTFHEWAAGGYPAPDLLEGQGFLKLTWSPQIAHFSGGQGGLITYAQWAAQAFPTPHVQAHYPGERFEKYGNNPTVYYVVPYGSGAITYSEWVAAGSPVPIQLPAR